jgi:hypothetical protein
MPHLPAPTDSNARYVGAVNALAAAARSVHI